MKVLTSNVGATQILLVLQPKLCMWASGRSCLALCSPVPSYRISRRELQGTENSRFICLLWKATLGTWGTFPLRRALDMDTEPSEQLGKE